MLSKCFTSELHSQTQGKIIEDPCKVLLAPLFNLSYFSHFFLLKWITYSIAVGIVHVFSENM
jgi:hypothetical protein